MMLAMDPRMENAQYWAAQVAGWLRNGPNAGIDGRYEVEVIGGRPVVALDDSWNEETATALRDGLREANFPGHIEVTEQAVEQSVSFRVFVMEPSDDRLVSDWYEGDWRAFLGLRERYGEVGA